MWISHSRHPSWRWWWMTVVVTTLQVITPIYCQDCKHKYTVRASINICGEAFKCHYNWKGIPQESASTLQLPGGDVRTVTVTSDTWNEVFISSTNMHNMIGELSTTNTLKIPHLDISEEIHCSEKYQSIIFTSYGPSLWSYGGDSSECASRIKVTATIRMCEDHVMYDPFFSQWVSKITLILPEEKMINVNTGDQGVHHRVEVMKVNKGKHPANTDNYNLTIKDLGVSGNLQCSKSSTAEVIITNDKITWNCSTDSSGGWWIYVVAVVACVATVGLLSLCILKRLRRQKAGVGETPPVTSPQPSTINGSPSRPALKTTLTGTPQRPITLEAVTSHSADRDHSCSDPAEHIYEDIDAFVALGLRRTSHESENSIYGLQGT